MLVAQRCRSALPAVPSLADAALAPGPVPGVRTVSETPLLLALAKHRIDLVDPASVALPLVSYVNEEDYEVTTVEWGPETEAGRAFYSAGFSGTIAVWSTTSPIPIRRVSHTSTSVMKLSYSGKSRALLAAGSDGTVICYEVGDNGDLIFRSKVGLGRQRRTTSLAWVGNRMAVAGTDRGDVCVLRVAGDRKINVLRTLSFNESMSEATVICDICPLGTGSFGVCDSMGNVSIWETSGKLDASVKVCSCAIKSMAYSDDSNAIVCGATDGSVVILTVAETLSQRTLLQPHVHEVRKVLVVKSPSDAGTQRHWMSVGADGCVGVGQLSTMETSKTVQLITNPFAISGSALCEDTLAPRAVAILARQGVELWSIPEPDATVETQQQQQQNNNSGERTVLLSPELVLRIAIEPAVVASIALSPNGRCLAISTMFETRVFILDWVEREGFSAAVLLHKGLVHASSMLFVSETLLVARTPNGRVCMYDVDEASVKSTDSWGVFDSPSVPVSSISACPSLSSLCLVSRANGSLRIMNLEDKALGPVVMEGVVSAGYSRQRDVCFLTNKGGWGVLNASDSTYKITHKKGVTATGARGILSLNDGKGTVLLSGADGVAVLGREPRKIPVGCVMGVASVGKGEVVIMDTTKTIISTLLPEVLVRARR